MPIGQLFYYLSDTNHTETHIGQPSFIISTDDIPKQDFFVPRVEPVRGDASDPWKQQDELELWSFAHGAY